MRFLALLFLLLASPAFALGVHHGTNTPPSPPNAPILTAMSFTLGQQTQAYRGYAFLHAQDFTSASYKPFTFSGLGLMSPAGPACDTWYTTFVSGRSSTDFDISSGVADASALTPLVNFNGQGHLTGTYVFHVQCSRAGVFSNVVNMTINTIANACNIGPQDRLDFGWCLDNGTFGSQLNSKILISTGTDWRGVAPKLRGIGLVSSSGNHVQVTLADSGRYPILNGFQMTGLSYVDVVDLVAAGDTDINGLGAIFGAVGPSSSQGNSLINLRYYGSLFMLPRTGQNSGQDAFDVSNCFANCVMQDLVADFASSGYQISPALHATNVDIGHYNNNCTATFSGAAAMTVDGFSTCHDPLINVGGQHTDCMQVLDGATAWGLKVVNFWCIQGGGPGDPQGTLFGGSQMGSKNDVTTGYVDDCTGTHGPGHYLTLTAGFYQSSSGLAQVWAPGGGLPISDDARLNFGDVVGSCVGLVTGGTGTNISARNVGSVGSPVSISNVGVFGLQMEGIINTLAGFNGFASSGESGTSYLRHFSFLQHKQNPWPSVFFSGTVNGVVGGHPSGSTITVTDPVTQNYASTMEPYVNGYLTFVGCSNCGGSSSSSGIDYELSSTEATNNATGTATFSVSGGKGYMTITGPCTGRWDYNVANGSAIGGLIVSGAGVPEAVFVAPGGLGAFPADGCAGTYQLNSTAAGTISSPIAVTGKPQNMAGLYHVFNAALTPIGPVAMSTSGADVVSVGQGAQVSQDQSGGSPGCVSRLHQGSFNIDRGYATYISPCSPTDAPNTTVTNAIATPSAANFNTGVLPYTTLGNITAATWQSYTTAQERAAVCNAILPALGGSLDLGGGDFIGGVTHTGEVQVAGGNIAVVGCAGH